MPKPKKPLHVYLIDESGDCYYYVARSKPSALGLFLKDHTYPKMTITQYRKESPKTTVTLCDDDREFTITSLASDTGGPEDEHRTLTMRAWAKEWGEGCLATNDF